MMSIKEKEEAVELCRLPTNSFTIDLYIQERFVIFKTLFLNSRLILYKKDETKILKKRIENQYFKTFYKYEHYRKRLRAG